MGNIFHAKCLAVSLLISKWQNLMAFKRGTILLYKGKITTASFIKQP